MEKLNLCRLDTDLTLPMIVDSLKNVKKKNVKNVAENDPLDPAAKYFRSRSLF